jgi:hypothetical protein
VFEEPQQGSTIGSTSSQAANAPNLSYTATPVFGNMNFTITAPPTNGKVEQGFPALSYLSIESLIFFQNMSNPNTNPTSILPGSNTGQQVVSGQVTQQDASGTSRYLQGTQQSTSS